MIEPATPEVADRLGAIVAFAAKVGGLGSLLECLAYLDRFSHNSNDPRVQKAVLYSDHARHSLTWTVMMLIYPADGPAGSTKWIPRMHGGLIYHGPDASEEEQLSVCVDSPGNVHEWRIHT